MAETTKAGRFWGTVGLLLILLLVSYVGSYGVVSRVWRSDLEAALGPNRLTGATSYVPIRFLFTEDGYRLHCALCGFYEPLWRLDQGLGGPSPISIFFGIGQKKG
jgi:hypothetical protein